MADQALINRFRKARKDTSVVVLEGFHALKHALRFGAEIEIIVVMNPGEAQRLAKALAPDIALKLTHAVQVTSEIFSQLAPIGHPTGVMALAKRPRADVKALLGKVTAPIVVLDRPQRLSNIGAVVRVAAAAGVGGVIVIGDRDPWAPEAIRGAAGLQFALPSLQVEELPVTNRPLVAIDPEGQPMKPGALPTGALLLFGSERSGIDPAVLARASYRLRIPMRPGVSSLNLATSVAAVLYAYGSNNTLQ